MSYHRRAASVRGETFFEDGWVMSATGKEAEQLASKAARFPLAPSEVERAAHLFRVSAAQLQPSAELTIDRENRLFKTSPAMPSHTPPLPTPYGLKGGAARSVLLTVVTGASHPPRDLDVIRKGTYYNAEDEKVACRYMPEDYKHGAKVELFQHLPKYMNSRDLTVNEVLLLEEVLFCSVHAALDAISYTLRPSRYTPGSLSKGPQLAGRILLKMVRLRAEFFALGQSWRIVGIPSDAVFTERDLAIHLEKALQRCTTVAEHFLLHLVELGFIEYSEPPLLPRLLQELSHLAYGDSAILRSVPQEYRELLKECHTIHD